MGDGRTTRTDQSDTGMCLCRGAGGASASPGGVTEPRAKRGRNQQNRRWNVGMGMRPLPLQLCHQQHFSWGSAPGLDALSSGG